MKKKNRIQKDILYLAISSAVLTIAWVSFNIFHTIATSTIEPDLQIQIEPIDPSFDINEIQKIKSRQQIEPIFTLQQSESSSPSASLQTPITGNQSGELIRVESLEGE